jgi:long-chain fatty acid transport protein
MDIKPTLAYKVTENLSLGLGADIYTFSNLVGEGQVERHAIPAAGVKTELNGKDTAAGFNASLLYTALRNEDGKPLANIGIVYRSQATLHLSGALLANGATASDHRRHCDLACSNEGAGMEVGDGRRLRGVEI